MGVYLFFYCCFVVLYSWMARMHESYIYRCQVYKGEIEAFKDEVKRTPCVLYMYESYLS